MKVSVLDGARWVRWVEGADCLIVWRGGKGCNVYTSDLEEVDYFSFHHEMKEVPLELVKEIIECWVEENL